MDLFTGREILLGTGILAIFQKLVRKWPLEKNLLPALCWTSIIPNYILQRISIPKGKGSFHPSSKKLLLTKNGDHDRKPQKDTMQRSADPEKLSHNGYISVTAPAFMASEKLRKRRWKDCKSHNTKKVLRNWLCWKWLHKQDWNRSNINGHVNVDAGSSCDVSPLNEELQTTNDCWEKENLHLPRMMSS